MLSRNQALWFTHNVIKGYKCYVTRGTHTWAQAVAKCWTRLYPDDVELVASLIPEVLEVRKKAKEAAKVKTPRLLDPEQPCRSGHFIPSNGQRVIKSGKEMS